METNTKDFGIDVDDDDVIEIIDSPVKTTPSGTSQEGGSKNSTIAPIFNIFNKPDTHSKQQRASVSITKTETPQKDARLQDASSSMSKGKRRADEDEEDRAVKKPKVDPVKMAQPLAERLRPTSLSNFVGQSDLVGEGSLLRSMLDTESGLNTATFGSIILWGPPGCGKTTMARLIATRADADFRELSATSAGTQDVRKVFEQARNQLKLLGRRTVLFIGKHT
jgi:putative ATPase